MRFKPKKTFADLREITRKLEGALKKMKHKVALLIDQEKRVESSPIEGTSKKDRANIFEAINGSTPINPRRA